MANENLVLLHKILEKHLHIKEIDIYELYFKTTLK